MEGEILPLMLVDLTYTPEFLQGYQNYKLI
nr:MAG TPA: hypothetical protein [Caudoviricetes sp.]